MTTFESGLVLGFMLGATVVYAAVWLILRQAKGPLDQGRDWVEPQPRELTEREIELAKGMANCPGAFGLGSGQANDNQRAAKGEV